MEKKKIFDILDIAETKDINIIKKAYRKKLAFVNPEDNPEGFKLLREAYEEAVRLVNVQEEITEDTPITNWIGKVENIYKKLSTRIDVNCWKELFAEELCKDFDTFTEVREAFLKFLMNNYRLPAEIWQLIQENFDLIDSREELCELFQEDFIDFVTEKPENKAWLNFTLFEGEEEEKVDIFISHYLTIRKMNDYRDYEDIDKEFAEINEIELTHPYLQVEKMRYYLKSKDTEKALEILNGLYLKKYEDLYIKYYIAEVSLECGQIEKAYEECKAILAIRPNHFGAKNILCSYYLIKEDYKKAKVGYMELLDIDSYNDTLLEGMKKANVGLIKLYKEQLEKEPDNKEIKMEIGWCLYQNNLYEDCIAFVQDIELEDKIYYDYYNLMSRAYIENENYEKADPYIKIWIEEILKATDDGSEEAKRKLRRLPYAYYLMSKCYFKYSLEKEDGKEELEQCIKYLDLAIEAEEKGNDIFMYLSEKASTLLKIQAYELCIDVCDEMLRIDEGYFPAYIYRQEAYFNLEMWQEVIDDYYKALEIYPGNAKPYILAVKTFLIYDQYEDAEGIINRAIEAKVESNELEFQKLKIERMKTKNYEERKAVAEKIEKLYTKSQEEAGDLEEPSSLLYEIALCYYDMEENELALEAINEKLKLNKSDGSMLLKADILYDLNKYEEAKSIYEGIIENHKDYANGYYKTGNCYNELGDKNKALENYLKVIEIDPEHKFVNNRLMEIYQSRYQKDYMKEDYNLAVDYAKRQAEIAQDCYCYTELGLVYLDGYDMENAIKAFDEASKCDDKSMYPYSNKGYVYKILENYEAAYKCYKAAIERIEDDNLRSYWNIAVYYKITGQYEKAIETYEMIVAKRKDSKEVREKLMDVYKDMGQWDEAIEQAKKAFEVDEDGEMDYLIDMGEIYMLAGDEKMALECYEEALKKYPEKQEPYRSMGNYSYWTLGDKEAVLKYYEKSYEVANKYDDKCEDYLDDLLHYISIALRELGRSEQALDCLEKLCSYHIKHYGSIEHWLDNPEFRKARLFYIAVWNYNAGKYEEAQHYIDLMKNTINCSQCSYCSCYEYIQLEAMMLEAKGDYKGAAEKYKKALEISPTSLDIITKLKEIKQKVKEG